MLAAGSDGRLVSNSPRPDLTTSSSIISFSYVGDQASAGRVGQPLGQAKSSG
jgi:hypothetical protein